MKLLNKWQVQKITGMKMTEIYSSKNFPKPVSVMGTFSPFWIETEIKNWMIK